MITFVTGASCSGKSLLYNELMDTLVTPSACNYAVKFVEIDAEGTPDAGHLPWLQWRGEQLLYEAVQRYQADKISTIVFGISWPHKIIESNVLDGIELDKFPRLSFVLLDITTKLLKERLRERLFDQSKKEIKEFIQYNRRLSDLLYREVRHQRNFGIVLSEWPKQKKIEHIMRVHSPEQRWQDIKERYDTTRESTPVCKKDKTE